MNTLNNITPGYYENYYQSSLQREFRRLQEEICVISIPREVYGVHLEPNFIKIKVNCSPIGTIIDDGEGKLYLNGKYVGDVIYTHGMIIVTDKDLAVRLNNCPNIDLEWKSNLPILTSNYHCKVHDYEFNFTQNPSAVTGSNGQLRDNVTGSYFQPYITAVGLYNDANELIAVGKFGQPIPKTSHTDMTFVIKMDI